MKILFISRWFPYPPNNGSKLRILHLLEGLAKVHEVWLLSFSDSVEKDSLCGEIKNYCDHVRVVPWKEFQPNSWQAVRGLFSPQPRSLVDTYSNQMEAEIRALRKNEHFDLVIMSQWQMAAYHPLVADTPSLIEELEVGLPYDQYHNAESLPARLRHGLTWAKHRLFLSGILKKNLVCTVVSEKEQQILAAIMPSTHSIYIIPNGVSYTEYTCVLEDPQPNTMIFTGSFRYHPNYEAMLWFIQEVYPILLKQVPDIRLTITGDLAGKNLPQAQGVNHLGFVDDVRPYLARAWVSLAPLRQGGGSRLKILEAMAIGTPVVATTKGAEGLNARNGEHLAVADSPEEFAQTVIEIMGSPELRRKYAENAQKLIRDQYDWEKIMPVFLEVVEKAARK